MRTHTFARVDASKTDVICLSENQRILLEKALTVVERVPAPAPAVPAGGNAVGEEPAWKNCWNWNLCDAAYGHLVLDIRDGRISSELKSQGNEFRKPQVVRH